MLPQALICVVLCFIDFKKGYFITGLWGWSYFLNAAIKNAAKIDRPNPGNHKVHVSGYSFPSGHSLTSLALYFPIARYFHLDEPMSMLVMALPFALGLTRIYFGVHRWIDIACGWLFAYAYLYFCEDFLNYTHNYFYDDAHSIFNVINSIVEPTIKGMGF